MGFGSFLHKLLNHRATLFCCLEAFPRQIFWRMLTWTIWISFLGAGLVMLIPTANKSFVRWTALLTACAGFLISLHAFCNYNIEDAGFQFGNGDGVPWVHQLGITFRMGVDGISLPLVLLTGIIAITGTLFSWNVVGRVKEFFAFYLVLIAGVYGVFQSRDAFVFFVFYEIAIIPKYFLIAIWGSTRKEYGAMKLALYSFVGSTFVLIGILALQHFTGPSPTFDIEALSKMNLPLNFQIWAFPLIFVGFAILAGMWPFHTWAPTGHVAAPTAASMLLAGVVMKLGAYGCLRMGLNLFPAAMSATIFGIPGFWKWSIAILATINIFYGAMVALVQKDFKFVIGYSSVSHMGFVLLGLATLNILGVSGAVMQMFSHGIVAGLLFAVVGRMVYERTHTRDLSQLGGLIHALPFAGVVFIIGGLASMGLPGFSGFFAELLVAMGVWKTFPWLLIPVGFGIIVTVVYTLRTIHAAFFGDRPATETAWQGLPPITIPEKIASLILVALLFIVGLYPSVLLDMVEKSSNQMLNHIKPSISTSFGSNQTTPK